MKFNFLNFLSVVLLGSTFFSCVDQEFDAPPTQTFEVPEPNATIADLKTWHEPGQFIEITDDLIINAIVVANDESGNFFREIIIQDETAGVELSINATSLFNVYPVGVEIFVRCQGLIISDFAGTISVGGGTFVDDNGGLRLSGIEETLLSQFVTIGLRDQPLPISSHTIADLSAENISTLVELDGIQFTDNNVGVFYADAINLQTLNLNMQDCNGDDIILRSSGFASFASETTPSGNGKIIGVYSVFNDDKQLFIRNTDDIAFNNARCDGTGGGGGGGTGPDLEPNGTIADLKAWHQPDAFVEITDELIISGIVVANDESGNYFKELIIQDETAGIELSLDAVNLAFNYPVGMEIFVDCQGLFISDFAGTIILGGGTEENNGELRLARIEESLIPQIIGTGERNQPLPISTTTIEELSEDDISTIIEIENIQFTDDDVSVTYADGTNLLSINLDLEDCDGNQIVLRSSGFASFANETTPGGNGTITAIYSVFLDTKQLFIRDTDDVNFNSDRCDGTSGGGGGGTDPTGSEILNESFDGLTDFEVLDLDGWSNIAEVGSDDERWYKRSFNDDNYAEVTAFDSNDPENILWLITPSFEIDGATFLNITTAQAFWVQDGLSVLISEDFDGDVEDANWTVVEGRLANEGDDRWEQIESGDINLNQYVQSGEVHLAFRYEGSANNGETTTFQLHEVLVSQ